LAVLGTDACEDSWDGDIYLWGLLGMGTAHAGTVGDVSKCLSA